MADHPSPSQPFPGPLSPARSTRPYEQPPVRAGRARPVAGRNRRPARSRRCGSRRCAGGSAPSYGFGGRGAAAGAGPAAGQRAEVVSRTQGSISRSTSTRA
ncbi:hypothetical protein EF879_10485 [Micromonospora sp. HM5-17]|nr:hypothetical protein EF879_10485 [Micromonospora sp. HM5-17]